MNRQANEKSFEWKIKFLVEGAFPSKLPKAITEECILEQFANEEKSRAILRVRVRSKYIPSKAEVERVRKIAYEKAQRTITLYSVFLGLLKILKLVSVHQVTPYEGKSHYLITAETKFTVAIPDKTWVEGTKFLEEIGTSQFEEYLSLALSHYSLASWMEPKSRFLNLMICMEALYNKDPQELRYRMSHRVANLLGRTEEMRKRMFDDFSVLYNKRNELAHGLKPVEISSDDNKLLLHYSKFSLLAFLKLRQKKQKVLDTIDNAVYDTKAREDIQHRVENIIEALEKKLTANP